jgi:uncharacterized FlaG/YvyC family protein
MVDSISSTPNLPELGVAQNRPQSSPVPPAPGAVNVESGLAPDQRVEVLRAAIEKLVKKSLPDNSRLQIDQDKETGTYIYRSIDPDTGKVIRQWPPEELLKLQEHIHEMEGMLVDKRV